MDSYVSLHTHTIYSTLDGHLLIGDYLARLRELGHTAGAITDHGTLAAAPEFHAGATAAGITPILGLEAYVAPSGRQVMDPKRREEFHLTLLALNETGYRHLCLLSTRAHLEGFYHKPRIDHELLAEYQEGIVCLSGCLASEAAQAALSGEEAAASVVARYHAIFGERFLLEVQDHGELIPEQRQVNAVLLELAKRFGLPVVATNDAHFCVAGDYEAQRALIGTNTAARKGGERIKSSPFTYIRSNEEMAAVFDPAWLAMTREVAGWVSAYPLGTRTPKLPRAPLEDPGVPPMQTLARLAWDGLARRCGVTDRAAIPAHYRDRLTFELGVVEQLSVGLGADFARYFLIVADLCAFATRHRIRFGPRGSAAGSVLCWALGISEPDPLRYGLVFERFLNPHRIQLPDIDIDVADDRRDEVLRYLRQTYGEAQVGRIATYTTYGARGAIQAAARYLADEIVVPGGSAWLAKELTQLIPEDPRPGGIPLEEVLDPELPAGRGLRERIAADPNAARIVETARMVAGRISAVGTHPAGVVIADRPLPELLPLMRTNKGSKGSVIDAQTQYAMDQLEALGLLKIDVLGLSTLATFDRALVTVAEQTGIELDPWEFPLDDPEAWSVIRKGHLLGCFQIGSSKLSRAVVELAPQTLDELALTIATYRPGPIANLAVIARRKRGEEPIESLHPELDHILAPTFGIPVYQEQILQIAQVFAGYSLGEADLLRKAIGKKQRELMATERARFAERARAHGRGEAEIARIWDFIAPHADYSFNRAHAICYAFLAYQSAYLKAHFPEAFYAAACSVEGRGTSQEGEPPQVRVGALIREAAERGVRVLPPTVLDPVADFVPRGRGQVRYGLRAVKDVAERAVEELVAAAAEAPFRSLGDLLERCPGVDKKSLLALAQVGAIPWHTRAALVTTDAAGKPAPTEALAQLLTRRSRRKGRIAKQLPLRIVDDLWAPIPDRTEYPPATLMAWEQERLGMFTTPLPRTDGIPSIPICDLPEHVGETVTVVGVIVQEKMHVARQSGKPMGYARIMDGTGSWNLTIFPAFWPQCKEHLKIGNFVAVHGKVTHERDGYDLWVRRIFPVAVEDSEAEHAHAS